MLKKKKLKNRKLKTKCCILKVVRVGCFHQFGHFFQIFFIDSRWFCMRFWWFYFIIHCCIFISIKIQIDSIDGSVVIAVPIHRLKIQLKKIDHHQYFCLFNFNVKRIASKTNHILDWIEKELYYWLLRWITFRIRFCIFKKYVTEYCKVMLTIH